VARVNGCSVIHEKDAEFGTVLTPTPAVVSVVLPSAKIGSHKISHLTPERRQELLQVLADFTDQFADSPGQCDAVVHRIQMTADFVPRQMRPYRVPDAVKPEVTTRSKSCSTEVSSVRPIVRWRVRSSASPRRTVAYASHVTIGT